MWMSQTPRIPFLWIDGYTYSIKDMKVIPVYDKFIKMPIDQDSKLDEIASRTEIFGEGQETSSFLLFEANVEKIVENDFNLKKLRELRVPVVV
jgi:hypothetical protein